MTTVLLVSGAPTQQDSKDIKDDVEGKFYAVNTGLVNDDTSDDSEDDISGESEGDNDEAGC